jgi:hypothetical protein
MKFFFNSILKSFQSFKRVLHHLSITIVLPFYLHVQAVKTSRNVYYYCNSTTCFFVTHTDPGYVIPLLHPCHLKVPRSTVTLRSTLRSRLTPIQNKLQNTILHILFPTVMDKFSKYSTSRMQLLPTSLLISLFTVLHDHSFYLVCPDVLSLIGEPLSADGCGSSNHIQL